MKKKLLLAAVLSLAALCACSKQPDRGDYVKAIAAELEVKEYQYSFTSLTPQTKERQFVCEFYAWKPSKSHSTWICGTVDGHISVTQVSLFYY